MLNVSSHHLNTDRLTNVQQILFDTKETCDSDVLVKRNRLFLGPCYTLPPSFLKTGSVVFCDPADRQTNGTKNITSLAEVIKMSEPVLDATIQAQTHRFGKGLFWSQLSNKHC